MIYVLSVLMTFPPGFHRVVATAHANTPDDAAKQFNAMASTTVTGAWILEATTGGTPPFVYATNPDMVVVLSVHRPETVR